MIGPVVSGFCAARSFLRSGLRSHGRLSAVAIIAMIVVLVIGGCGGASKDDQVAATLTDFYGALAEGEGQKACGLLDDRAFDEVYALVLASRLPPPPNPSSTEAALNDYEELLNAYQRDVRRGNDQEAVRASCAASVEELARSQERLVKDLRFREVSAVRFDGEVAYAKLDGRAEIPVLSRREGEWKVVELGLGAGDIAVGASGRGAESLEGKCGSMLIDNQEYVVERRGMSCARARDYIQEYASASIYPSGFRCTARSDEPYRCWKGDSFETAPARFCAVEVEASEATFGEAVRRAVGAAYYDANGFSVKATTPNHLAIWTTLTAPPSMAKMRVLCEAIQAKREGMLATVSGVNEGAGSIAYCLKSGPQIER